MSPADEAAELYAAYEHAAKADRRAMSAWTKLLRETGDWDNDEAEPARAAQSALAVAKAAARDAHRLAGLDFRPSPHEMPLLFDGVHYGPSDAER